MIVSINSPRSPVALLPKPETPVRGEPVSAHTENSFTTVEPSHTIKSAEFGEILQGEVLTRSRFVEYQSTQGFLDERAVSKARLVQDFRGSSSVSDVAVQRYLQSAISSQTNQGRSLDVHI